MADCSSELIGPIDTDQLNQKTKDIFNGKALIDRLLVYFSKFEGSRDKAKRYAQKLLDLGHIESLAHSLTFEDSLQEYKWTDVASVVNKAKTKMATQEFVNGTTVVEQNSTAESKYSSGSRPHRPMFKISIEAENCDGAEIRAHIRTNPNISANMALSKSGETGGKVCLTDVQNGKMISFVTETSKTEEILRLVPASASVMEEESLITKLKSKCNKQENTDCIENKTNISGGETQKECDPQVTNTSEVDSAVELDNSSTIESSSPITTSITSGQGDTSSNTEATHLKGYSNTESLPAYGKSVPTEPVKTKTNLHRYKWSASKTSQNAAEDQHTDGAHEKSYSSAHPSGKRDSKRRSLSSVSSPSESEKSFTPPNADRKFKFKEDNEWMKMRREYLENEEIRQATEKQQKFEVFDNTGMTLHSSSVVTGEELITISNRRTSTPENSPDNNDKGTGQGKMLHSLSPPVQPVIVISPPPSESASPRKTSDPNIKSLFWTKLVCNSVKPEEMEEIFWLNLEKKIPFDEAEFSKLFQKPASSPVRKNPRSRVSQKQAEDGKSLKALSTERSRQVGIRASTVRLPVEDIHDAIINMDDAALDLDSVEALYDVRPTPDELDDIADVLKRYPNGILDKPEQFVLMIAMIGNLDERLKSWIFAKKFPDRVLDIKDQLDALSTACIQIVRNSFVRRLLEATLVLGNHMNKGTQRGEADGYSFDILPKLKDVKSQFGDTNLLLYLVRWMSKEQEKSNTAVDIMERENAKASDVTGDEQRDDCKLPSQTILQKASSVSLPEVMEEIEYLTAELNECKEQIIPTVIEGATCMAEIKIFNERMTSFIDQAEKGLLELQALCVETTDIAEEFKRYYVPVDTKSESISNMLKHLNTFCEDFRSYWDEEKRNAAKEAYFNTEKARRQRMAAVKIAKSPSALKARFLEKRRREKLLSGESSNDESPRYNGRDHAHEKTKTHLRIKTQGERQETPSRRPMEWKESSDKARLSESTARTQSTPVSRKPFTRARQDFRDSQRRTIDGGITHNGVVNGDNLKNAGDDTKNVSGQLSKMKLAMTKRRMLLKSKTC